MKPRPRNSPLSFGARTLPSFCGSSEKSRYRLSVHAGYRLWKGIALTSLWLCSFRYILYYIIGCCKYFLTLPEATREIDAAFEYGEAVAGPFEAPSRPLRMLVSIHLPFRMRPEAEYPAR